MSKFLNYAWFKPSKSSRMDENGHETLDDKPLSLPMGFKKPESLAETVARLVRSERFKYALDQQGVETFEEADDFDVNDDYDPSTPYEEVFDPILKRGVTPDEFMRNRDEYKKQYVQAFEPEQPIQSSGTTAKRPQEAGDAVVPSAGSPAV